MGSRTHVSEDDYYRHRLAVADQENFRILVFDWFEVLTELGLLIDTTPPKVQTHLGNITVKPGEKMSLQWVILDEGLSGNYSLIFDNFQFIDSDIPDPGREVIRQGYWKADEDITYYSARSLAQVVFSYEFLVYDRSGNFLNETGWINILEDTIKPTTSLPNSNETTDSPTSMIGITLLLISLIILTRLRRIKK